MTNTPTLKSWSNLKNWSILYS